VLSNEFICGQILPNAYQTPAVQEAVLIRNIDELSLDPFSVNTLDMFAVVEDQDAADRRKTIVRETLGQQLESEG
jgi:hypothetical protein